MNSAFVILCVKMATNESQIIALLQSNPASAVSRIMDSYGDALYGLVCRMIPEKEVADEIVQDALVKVWQNAGSYDPSKGKLYTWLARITWNTALDKVRSGSYKRAKKSESLDTNVYAQNLTEQTEHADVGVQKAISRLDEKYREVIDLVYFSGYSHSEASELLQIPIGTVKSRVRIAIRELHVALRDVVLWVGLVGIVLLIELILRKP